MPDSFLVVAIVIGLAVLGGLLVFLSQGAPFVRTSDDNLADMLKAVGPSRERRLIDLGAGDGKLMMEFAKRGYSIDGVEIKPWRAWQANRRFNRAGVSDRATIRTGNLWSTDVSQYDVVLLYAVPHVMSRLEKKLTAELRPGSLVISNHFSFPKLKPSRTVGSILVYKINKKASD